MGSAGALLIYAAVTAGGRVVHAIYNRATRRPQLLYNENDELIDFPTDQVVQPQHDHDRDDKPTTPRPATTTIEDEARPQQQQFGGDQIAHTTSQSTDTPVAALFQEANDEHDWTLQMTDEQTRLDRERVGRGKWAEMIPEDAVKENILLRKKIQYYDNQADTAETTKDPTVIAITETDNMYVHCPWIPAVVNRMSPNASPDNGMKHIVDNFPRWALTAMTIGQFPKPRMVNGGVIDATNIVKVEIELFKRIATIVKGVSPTTNGNGGVGFGENGGMGMTSPSTVGDVTIP